MIHEPGKVLCRGDAINIGTSPEKPTTTPEQPKAAQSISPEQPRAVQSSPEQLRAAHGSQEQPRAVQSHAQRPNNSCLTNPISCSNHQYIHDAAQSSQEQSRAGQSSPEQIQHGPQYPRTAQIATPRTQAPPKLSYKPFQLFKSCIYPCKYA